MDNVYWGVAVVICCTAGYYFSYTRQRQGQYTMAVALLMLCGLILRIYTATDLQLHFWDERYHALVAKNLSRHMLMPTLYEQPLLPFNYRGWEYNHIWVHKQPVTLWLMALAFKIFGVHAWVARLPSVIMTTVGIKLVYDIGTRLYSKQHGYVAAFLLSINGLIIELAAGRVATDHVDVACMFFVLAAVWCGVMSMHRASVPWTALCGVSVGAAVLCKWLPALIAVPVVALLMAGAGRRKAQIAAHMGLLLAVVAVVVLPWQWYIMHTYPNEATWEYEFNLLHFKEVLANQGGNFFYHFNMLRMNYGELVYIPAIWITYIAITGKNLYDAAMLLWFWVPYVFFSFSATKMQGYTLLSAPAVFMIIARAYYALRQESLAAERYKTAGLVVAYAFVLLPIRYTIERVKPFTALERNPEWLREIKQLKRTAYNSPRTVVFNCSHPIEMMFETECTCYPGYGAEPPAQQEMGLRMDSASKQLMPADTVIAKLQKDGYTVMREHDGRFTEVGK